MYRTRSYYLKNVLVGSLCVVVLMFNVAAIGTRAREHAKQMVCLTHVEQLTGAWLAYQEDHDGQLVNGEPRSQISGWVKYGPGGSFDPESEQVGIKAGTLWPYMGEAIQAYRCPSSPVQLFRSYSIAGGANGEMTARIAAKRYNEIKTPSQKYIFVEDVDPRGVLIGSWLMNYKAPAWIDPVAVWHPQRTTLGYADGHAELHAWQDASFIAWCESALADSLAQTMDTFSFGLIPLESELADIDFMASGYPLNEYWEEEEVTR